MRSTLKQIGLSVLLLLMSNTYVSANKSIEYLYLTYDAEDAIIRGDYVTALAIYKKAFEKKGGKIFAEDRFNALKCATLLNDSTYAKVELAHLAQSGIGSNFLQTNFSEYFSFNQSYFNKQCTLSDSIAESRAMKTKRLRFVIDSLVNEDQKYHEIWSQYISKNKVEFAKIDEDSVYKKMTILDKQVSQALYRILKGGNSLSEFQLGPFIGKGKFLWQPNYAIIILHNYQGSEKTSDTLFHSLLKQQIEDGYIKPTYLANLSDQNSSPLKPNYGNAAIYTKSYKKQLYYNKYIYGIGDTIDRLNSNRKSIHLFSLEKQLKRVYFMLNNTHNFHIRHNHYTTSLAPEKEFDELYQP